MEPPQIKRGRGRPRKHPLLKNEKSGQKLELIEMNGPKLKHQNNFLECSVKLVDALREDELGSLVKNQLESFTSPGKLSSSHSDKENNKVNHNSYDNRNLQQQLNFECPHCNVKFSHEEHMNYHIKFVHNKIYNCKLCNKNFSSLKEFNQHTTCDEKKIEGDSSNNKLHSSERFYNCFKCTFTTEKRRILREHLFQEHNIKKSFSCFRCSKTFPDYDELKKHEKKAHLKRTYGCPECNASFIFETSVKRHIRIIHKLVKTDHCKICNKSFSQSFNYKSHMKKIHGFKYSQKRAFKNTPYINKTPSIYDTVKTPPKQTKYLSTKTKKTTTAKKRLMKFVAKKVAVNADFSSESNIDEVVCYGSPEETKDVVCLDSTQEAKIVKNVCKETSIDKNNFTTNTSSVYVKDNSTSKDTLGLNKDCNTKNKANLPLVSRGKETLQMEQLSKLLQVKDRGGQNKNLKYADDVNTEAKDQIICRDCLSIFSTYEEIEQHAKIVHSSMNDYTCFDCSKTFTHKNILKAHINQYHKQLDKYKCENCDSMYANRATLVTHILQVHLKDDIKPCGRCPISFNSKGIFLHHSNIGTCNKKIFLCEICNNAFTARQKLARHIDGVHKKLKPYECEICETSFSTPGNRNQHIRAVHQKIKPYKCPECHWSFTSNASVKQHFTSVHLRLKPYRCDQCSAAFSWKLLLKQHINQVHDK